MLCCPVTIVWPGLSVAPSLDPKYTVFLSPGKIFLGKDKVFSYEENLVFIFGKPHYFEEHPKS